MNAAELAPLVEQERARLVSLRMQMLDSHPFWGFLLLPLQLVPAPGLGVPMTTDFLRYIWYDPECTQHLRIRQLGYVLLHQVCHLAFATIARKGARNTYCWHRATDLAINRMIEPLCAEGSYQVQLYELPTTVVGGETRFEPLCDARFGGRPAEAIYEVLIDELINQEQGATRVPGPRMIEIELPGEAGDDDGEGDGVGEAESEGEGDGDGDGDADGAGEGDDDGDGDADGGGDADGNGDGDGDGDGGNARKKGRKKGSKRGVGTRRQQVMDHGSGIDVHLAPPTDDRSRELLMERMIDAYVRWESSGRRGTVPGEFARVVEAARGFTVNWRRLFHQLADPCLGMDELSLARPHKRYLAQDLLVAGPVSEQLPSLVVSVDTSGSMGSDFLNRVFTELEKLAELTEECLLIVSDAKVHDVVPTAKLAEFFQEKRLRGGGGTSHVPVFNYLRDHHLNPTLFVGITDLYSEFPAKKPMFPVIWLVPNSHGTAPFGNVVPAGEDTTSFSWS
ncbi:hypothetical protein KKC22_13640 [Myxococcota bacterium]|nr:hypothetical protein [Myxococcota bacterium]